MKCFSLVAEKLGHYWSFFRSDSIGTQKYRSIDADVKLNIEFSPGFHHEVRKCSYYPACVQFQSWSGALKQ